MFPLNPLIVWYIYTVFLNHILILTFIVIKKVIWTGIFEVLAQDLCISLVEMATSTNEIPKSVSANCIFAVFPWELKDQVETLNP